MTTAAPSGPLADDSPSGAVDPRGLPGLRGTGVVGHVSVGIVVIACAIAVLGPTIAPHPPNEVNLSMAFVGPTPGHLLGFDSQGRDLLSRLLVGARTTILGPTVVVAIGMVFGTLLAIASAWRGGRFDEYVTAALNVLFAFPAIVLAILASVIIAPGLPAATLALAVAYTPYIARVLRSAALRERSKDYIAALEVQGFGAFTICTRHLVRNLMPLLVAQAAILFGYAMVDLAAISFLGLGVQPPQADWGVMVGGGQSGVLQGYPMESLASGLCIIVAVVAVNLLGERLTDRGKRGQPLTTAALLSVDDLTVHLPVGGAARRVLNSVSFTIEAGGALALVGESGSGKSMTARSIARILPPGATVDGTVRFEGTDVATRNRADMRSFRSDVAVVFQDARAHTNPVRSIGDFMLEALVTNEGVAPGEARRRAVGLLDDVGIDDGERRLRQYPHELSGGLLQRVMIATALLTEPKLLLADEPTTALDVTTQAEVVGILDELRQHRGMAMLFITHDLELAGSICDRTAVMYAGQIVEERTSSRLHDDPLHPYSAGLVAARPRIDTVADRLAAIPGRPLSAFEVPSGCAFADRCLHFEPACATAPIPLEPLDGGLVRCQRSTELRGRLNQDVHG